MSNKTALAKIIAKLPNEDFHSVLLILFGLSTEVGGWAFGLLFSTILILKTDDPRTLTMYQS